MIPDWPLAQEIIHALGWTLVHFTWQGAIIAAAFWAITVVARPGGAQVRYWSGLIGLAVALAVPVGTFIIYLDAGLAPVRLYDPVVAHVAVGARPSLWTAVSMGIEPILPWVVWLWTAGVFVLGCRTGIGWWGTQRLVRHGVAPVGPEWERRAADIAARLGVSRPVRLLRSRRVTVPTVIGWLKPVILLPASVLTRLPAEQIELVLAHELGHVRRNDYLFNLLQLLVETLLFYHPAIRWMSRRIRAERELCCDDLVISRCGQRELYVRSLAGLEFLRSDVPLGALAATGGDVFGRLERIIEGGLPRSSAGVAQVSLLVVLTALAAAGARPAVDPFGAPYYSRLAAVELTVDSVAGHKPPQAHGLLAHNAVREMTQRAEAEAEAERLAAERRAAAERERARLAAARAPAVADRVITPAELVTDQALMTPAALKIPPPARPARPDVTEIRPITTRAPKYPFLARGQGVEGFVKLSFVIDHEGRPADIRVVDAYPADTFDDAALDALEEWRFEGGDELRGSLRLVQVFDFTLTDPVHERREAGSCSLTSARTCDSFNRNMHVVYMDRDRLEERRRDDD